MRRRTLLVVALIAALLPLADRAPASGASCAPTVGVAGGEWRSFGHDLSNTRHQTAERVISPASVLALAPEWAVSTIDAGAEGDITGTPTVADGCLYVGTNRGWVLALNADTGEVVWATELPGGGGVNSSVTVDGGRVYAEVSRTSRAAGCSGDACQGPYVVALDQPSGAVVWSTPPIDTQPGADVYGSPVVFEGTLLAGVSGGSAELGDEADRYGFQGSMVFLDAASGGVLAKTWTIHPPHQPDDEFAGAGIWSTPAVDPVAKVAFAGTANPFRPEAEHEHANAVVKFDVDRASPTFGQIVGSYKGNVDEYVPVAEVAPCVDVAGNPPPYYPQGAGACGDIDLDFGASPNLFTDTDGRLLVGAGQKSGVYHAFDAATMAPVWSTPVGPPSPFGGVVGSTAFDGNAVYGPVTIPGHVWSVGLDGGLRWVSPTLDAVHWGNPVAVANGLVYTVDLKGFLDVYDARTGVPLLQYPLALGGTGGSPTLSWGGVSVARNTVYAAVGVSSLPEGWIVAFRLDGDGGGGGVLPEPGGLPDLPAGPIIVAGPGAASTTYATPVMVTQVGGPLSFTNADIPQHDVISEAVGPDGAPLFRTPLIGIGEVVPVEGIDRVESGRSYGFYCSIHPGMRGTLIVR
jgi:polyvinyl alcohol dehydrogenase (cytochrome)